MSIRTILTQGDPALSKRCHPVTKFDGKLADLLILDTDTYEDLIYKYGRNPIETIIKKGKVAAKGGILCI